MLFLVEPFTGYATTFGLGSYCPNMPYIFIEDWLSPFWPIFTTKAGSFGEIAAYIMCI